MRSLALLLVASVAACGPESTPKRSMTTILSDHHLGLVYETKPLQIYVTGYYFVAEEDTPCRESSTAAMKEMLTSGYVTALYYDRRQGFETVEGAQTWRVPEQQIPSWGNGPSTVTRRYEEHEQAYFIPLADVIGKDVNISKDVSNPIHPPAYAVIIPEAIEDSVMVMYAEQKEAHPGVAFYRCKSSTSSSPSPN